MQSEKESLSAQKEKNDLVSEEFSLTDSLKNTKKDAAEEEIKKLKELQELEEAAAKKKVEDIQKLAELRDQLLQKTMETANGLKDEDRTVDHNRECLCSAVVIENMSYETQLLSAQR